MILQQIQNNFEIYLNMICNFHFNKPNKQIDEDEVDDYYMYMYESANDLIRFDEECDTIYNIMTLQEN